MRSWTKHFFNLSALGAVEKPWTHNVKCYLCQYRDTNFSGLFYLRLELQEG